jgi:type VI secretion system secreted protein Hcp
MSSNGKEIKEMTLALCRAGGDKTKFFEVKLTGCVITGYDFEGSGDLPTENITFSYSKIGWTYILQRRSDGAGGGQVAAGWDLSANKQV